ncbi:hypothetical protein C7972_111119 [Arenibacter sp. ARW7G5Y1]|nr:hypothetical protein C7972_111119 [Arenibacter sp. ARW7G5Y1]
MSVGTNEVFLDVSKKASCILSCCHGREKARIEDMYPKYFTEFLWILL